MKSGALLVGALAVAAGLTVYQRESTPGHGIRADDAAGAQAPAATAASPDARAREDATPPDVPRAAASGSGFMPALRTAADHGDARAACQLAFALETCGSLADTEMSLTLAQEPPPESSEGIDRFVAREAQCRGAAAADLRDTYRYQVLASATGGPMAERWFLQRPMLADSDFLNNTAKAEDFRRRAKAYTARALQRRSADDLPMLLRIYWPEALGASASRYRVQDDAMFLVLADAAQRAGLADKQLRAVAEQLRRTAPPPTFATVSRLEGRFGGAWAPSSTSTSSSQGEASFTDASCTSL